MKSILIVEDDASLAVGLCRSFHSSDINAVSCGCLCDARKKLREAEYDLIILDVNLPDGDGFSLLKEIKQEYCCAVIMLTANDLESDIVAGLEQGADDYVTKPFSLAVLRARVQKQLQNREERQQREESPNRYSCDDYLFDFESMEFYHGDERVELSKTEQKLLRLLTANAGRTMTRDTLVDRIWTDGAEYVEENALSVTVKRVRDKLDAGDYIKTVYGVGYTWVREL